jgi:hypothetical protein
MTSGKRIVHALAALFLQCNICFGQDVNDLRWPCYGPLPNHPTQQEKAAFINEITAYAIEAERKYNVPAPAIAAMSIVESGYGFTRTAIFANNLFGFKWIGSSSASENSYFTLECQPSWDVGNKYIRFPNRAGAIDYVAQRLAKSRYYREDTKRFAESILLGRERRTAINDWIVGIADPYNYAPSQYVRSIIRLINDPISPSDVINESWTLYRFSP